MAMRWEDAIAAITGPDGPFPIVEAEVLGRATRVFRNTPPSLRALFAAARARGDAPFLVYEDERWSFADVMAAVDALGAAWAYAGLASVITAGCSALYWWLTTAAPHPSPAPEGMLVECAPFSSP